MIAPVNFEEKIGFGLIKDMLILYCKGEGGKALVSEIAFSADYATLKKELQLTDEFRKMMLSHHGYVSSEYFNLDEELTHIHTPGSFLPAETLLALLISYKGFGESYNFIAALPEGDFPLLHDFIADYTVIHPVIATLERVLDAEGNIKDNASPLLMSIRKDLSRQALQIDKRVAHALQQAKNNKLVDADVEAVVREGRIVIPVMASNKRKISGVIIDESQSGQTAYIEPIEVFELRNSIRELELAEKREIIKILTDVADDLRSYIPVLKQSFVCMGRLDFLHAKTMFALQIDAMLPLLYEKPQLNWLRAKHPLLRISLKKQNREIVPLDIALTETNRILIISGPNAGGKSVCLKTVGLLQYMLQCGLLIPVLDTSEAGVFQHIFIDIGDQQSIENDLSTYSSHLLNIKNMVLHANSDTLFLIDEFGAGTEPHAGGAIAEAVLETLNQKQAYGVVTTHYGNLKQLASHHEGFINAAMLYDTKAMKPLFVLRAGKPGSSFAFEIAQNINFPQQVLDKAGEKVGYAQLDFDKQMQDLEAERLELTQKEKQLQVADETLHQLVTKYNMLNDELTMKKKNILENARREAKLIVENANKIIEKTIKEIKETKADKEKTKQIREKAKILGDEITKEKIKKEEKVNPVQEPDIKVPQHFIKGAHVKIAGQQEVGVIADVNEKDATVAFNTVVMKVALNKLEVVSNKQLPKKQVNKGFGYQNMVNDMNARMANFRLTADVRGMRADEMQALISRYIDEAIMLHVPEVSILHGKGNGILRNVVREYLQSVPEIKQFYDAPVEFGGTGITIVRFK